MAIETLPSGTSELAGISYLFGYPIAHSLSPLLHQTIYDALQVPRAQIPFPSTNISQFLALTKDPKFYGASVTMPHKIAIMQHLDHLTDEAREVGACNTIYVREIEGKRMLCGANTDVVGVREAFFQNVPNRSIFQRRPGMVIGGGGAARSAVYAMKRWMRCDPIYLVNRDGWEVEALMAKCEQQSIKGRFIHIESVEHAAQVERLGAIVACVPDFPPVTEGEVKVRKIIETVLAKPHKGTLLEMCYHPSPWTQIAVLAKSAHWHVVLGIQAMIWQGVEQDRYWTGLPPEKVPVERLTTAIDIALFKSCL